MPEFNEKAMHEFNQNLIKEFRAAKTDFQYELYSGAGHGFSTPKDKAEERANVQSIASTERFLKEVFAR